MRRVGLSIQQDLELRKPGSNLSERRLTEEPTDVAIERRMDVYVPFLQDTQKKQRQSRNHETLSGISDVYGTLGL